MGHSLTGGGMNNYGNLPNLLLDLIKGGEEVSNGDTIIDIWFQTS